MVRTGPLVDNAFSSVIGLLSEYLDIPGGRKGVTVDIGGGQHIWEIDLVSLGAPDGQWGYTDDTTVVDEATATGADRRVKQNVLMNYIVTASIDSFTPARLYYGEYAPNGEIAEHASVYFEDPNVLCDRDEASTFDASMTLVETLSLDQTLTGGQQNAY